MSQELIYLNQHFHKEAVYRNVQSLKVFILIMKLTFYLSACCCFCFVVC